jgi:Na+/H+ antiporter NhaC
VLSKRTLLAFLLLFCALFSSAQELVIPMHIIAGIEYQIEVVNSPENAESILVNGKRRPIVQEENRQYFNYTFEGPESLQIHGDAAMYEVNPVPLWLSIIPPLLAIVMALLFREVLTSLILGTAFGAVVLGIYADGFVGIFTGLFSVIDTYLVEAVLDRGHISVIVFSMVIGGVVALISKNGGMQAVVDRLSKFATNARNGQFAIYFLGIAIFFDDYANTLVVGNTMRPVTDRLGISREKLSYIVDSTAAPIAAVGFITTWIGAELGYIQSGLSQIPELSASHSAYGIFLASLQYSFYPILTLIFLFLLIRMKRDFGPMLDAERLARRLNLVEQEEEHHRQREEAYSPKPPKKAYNAILPILAIVLVSFIGLYYTGLKNLGSSDATGFERLSLIIGNADSFKALLWGSFSGLGLAFALTLIQGYIGLEKTVKSLVGGFESLLPAILVLILAWSLASITELMHTADFLVGLMKGNLHPALLPTVAFLLAAVVSFSTGSSWGTMAILYPLLLGTSWVLGSEAGMNVDQNLAIFLNVTASILAGSVLGDHCSPISDTTILSSLATGTDHIQHVRTQLPYALSVGGVACLLGTLPAGFGMPTWILIPLGAVALYLLIRFFGKPSEAME